MHFVLELGKIKRSQRIQLVYAVALGRLSYAIKSVVTPPVEIGFTLVHLFQERFELSPPKVRPFTARLIPLANLGLDVFDQLGIGL